MSTDLETQLNRTIRLLMARTKARQLDVAEAVGLKRSSFTLRLQGRSAWKVSDLPPVADFFGLTVCELLSGYEAIPRKRLPPEGRDGN